MVAFGIEVEEVGLMVEVETVDLVEAYGDNKSGNNELVFELVEM